MNANKLADELEDALANDSWCQECALETTEPVARQAAAMLRQQQAEIDQLRSWIAPEEVPANVRIMYQIFDGKKWLNMRNINERK